VSKTDGSWVNRLLIAFPFAIAALLNALMLGVEHFHLRLDHIARYGFVFAGPWAWVANAGDITNHLNVQNQWLRGFVAYVALLWIPAVLYSACVWLLLVVLRIATRPLLKHLDPQVVKTLKRRGTIISIIVIVTATSWIAVRQYHDQNACNRRSAAFVQRVESIRRDADEKLSIGTTSGDVAVFFAEHGIPFQIVGSEAIGTLYTTGCGPLGCGTDSALIGVRVKLDSAGAVTEKPTVVGMYTDCL
jgi:lysylphosphatidylglycerol synthetase-like protein (DUF2156 family)